MTTSRGSSNAGASGTVDCADDVVETIRRDLMTAGASTPSDDSTERLIHKALAMLNAVEQLLSALSPGEIQGTAHHVYLGRLDGQAELLWSVYSRRHQVLAEVFASQHAAFRQLARAFGEDRLLSGKDTRSALVEGVGKVQP